MNIILYAWLGEDELGSGEVGLKQAYCAAGLVPLVATSQTKMEQKFLLEQLKEQADAYGKTVTLCKFVFQEEVMTITPKEKE